MELMDLVIELERFCARNDIDKHDSVYDLIEYMNKLAEEEL